MKPSTVQRFIAGIGICALSFCNGGKLSHFILRPRQVLCVKNAVEAIKANGDTLIVAPTGAGKTMTMSEIIGQLTGKTLVIAHRDELTTQNLATFQRVNAQRQVSTSIFDSRTKSWEGDVVFAMVQTLASQDNIKTMPFFDNIVIDEAHRAVAPSYQRILKHARSMNPDMNLLGLTATPNRGDKKGLGKVFSNVADRIWLGELILSGHLVQPRTYTIEKVMNAEKLKALNKDLSGEYDMGQAEEIMNVDVVNDLLLKEWKEKASDRQSVAFCSTVVHARTVCESFKKAGIKAATLYSKQPGAERRSILEAYAKREIQVVTNCLVLTEGWDDQQTSCIVLLRPCSFKSTYTQMVGRGLRSVDPDKYPGVVKEDCLVLDFGASATVHGTLEGDVDMAGKKPGNSVWEPVPHLPPDMSKLCPECDTQVHIHELDCPNCGHTFRTARNEAFLYEMKEYDTLLRSAGFRWVRVSLANGTVLSDEYDHATPMQESSSSSGTGRSSDKLNGRLDKLEGCEVVVSSAIPDGAWAGVFYNETNNKWITVVSTASAEKTVNGKTKRIVKAIAASDSRFLAACQLCHWANDPASPMQSLLKGGGDQNNRKKAPISVKQRELVLALTKLTVGEVNKICKHDASVLISMLLERPNIYRAMNSFIPENKTITSNSNSSIIVY